MLPLLTNFTYYEKLMGNVETHGRASLQNQLRNQ